MGEPSEDLISIPPASGVRFVEKRVRSYKGWDWPDEVPISMDETYALYQGMVQGIIRKMVRFGEPSDISQQVWLELTHSQLIDRFLGYALRAFPITLTGEQACCFLGIEWDYWVILAADLETYGQPEDPKSLYHTKAILEVDYLLGSQPRPYLRQFPVELSAKNYANYLASSVRNRVKNCFRTHTRRFAKNILSGDDVIRSVGAKMTHHLPKLSGSYTLDPDVLLDAVRFQARGGKLPDL